MSADVSGCQRMPAESSTSRIYFQEPSLLRHSLSALFRFLKSIFDFHGGGRRMRDEGGGTREEEGGGMKMERVPSLSLRR